VFNFPVIKGRRSIFNYCCGDFMDFAMVFLRKWIGGFWLLRTLVALRQTKFFSGFGKCKNIYKKVLMMGGGCYYDFFGISSNI